MHRWGFHSVGPRPERIWWVPCGNGSPRGKIFLAFVPYSYRPRGAVDGTSPVLVLLVRRDLADCATRPCAEASERAHEGMLNKIPKINWSLKSSQDMPKLRNAFKLAYAWEIDLRIGRSLSSDVAQ